MCRCGARRQAPGAGTAGRGSPEAGPLPFWTRSMSRLASNSNSTQREFLRQRLVRLDQRDEVAFSVSECLWIGLGVRAMGASAGVKPVLERDARDRLEVAGVAGYKDQAMLEGCGSDQRVEIPAGTPPTTKLGGDHSAAFSDPLR